MKSDRQKGWEIFLEGRKFNVEFVAELLTRYYELAEMTEKLLKQKE